MRGIGTISMILLFAVGFTLWLGSGGKYGIGFLEFIQAVSTTDINTIANMVINSFTSPLFIGTITVTALATVALSRSIHMVLLAILLTSLANIFFMPFTFVSELNLPVEIMYLIKGFFSMMLIIAIVDFITGSEW